MTRSSDAPPHLLEALASLNDALTARLERTGAPVSFWWRDDDLEAPSTALDAMLGALGEIGIAPAFAAIPATVSQAAIAALNETGAVVFPHGWAHANHEPADRKKSEYGPARPADMRLAEIARGWTRIRDIAGDRALGVFTPPWNRIEPALLERLDETGVVGVSTYRSTPSAPTPSRLPRMDTHVDLIDWRGGRAPLSADAVIERLLIWMRDGEASGGQPAMGQPENRDKMPVDNPIGILSHHRVTPVEAWSDWAPIWRILQQHPGTEWVSPGGALCMVSERARKS
jgi:hypothetical protein